MKNLSQLASASERRRARQAFLIVPRSRARAQSSLRPPSIDLQVSGDCGSGAGRGCDGLSRRQQGDGREDKGSGRMARWLLRRQPIHDNETHTQISQASGRLMINPCTPLSAAIGARHSSTSLWRSEWRTLSPQRIPCASALIQRRLRKRSKLACIQVLPGRVVSSCRAPAPFRDVLSRLARRQPGGAAPRPQRRPRRLRRPRPATAGS